jgi:hypothetical protein
VDEALDRQKLRRDKSEAARCPILGLACSQLVSSAKADGQPFGATSYRHVAFAAGTPSTSVQCVHAFVAYLDRLARNYSKYCCKELLSRVGPLSSVLLMFAGVFDQQL